MNLMRVIEPHQLKVTQRRKRRWPYIAITMSGLIIILGGYFGLSYIMKLSDSREASTFNPSSVIELPTVVRQYVTPKEFTPTQLRDLYLSVLMTYPNTDTFTQPPDITGDKTADARIRKIAEERGFQLTRIPVGALIKTNEPRLAGQTDDLLQPLAYEGWQELKAAAKKDNIPLELYSAYRSPEWQRQLFLSRMKARGVTADQIVNGYADGALREILSVTGIPGYSRHHSGYAVDFWCEDASGLFENSKCATWLEDNNFLRAKQAGWIPSYPEGAGLQGPEPEAWEYVWVGKTLLFKD